MGEGHDPAFWPEGPVHDVQADNPKEESADEGSIHFVEEGHLTMC